MNRDQKSAVVDELAGQLKAAETVYAIDYRGISVTQAAELRSRLREAEAVFRIVKNSLTERASDAAGVPELKPMLDGPTALTFVTGDAALAAKALNDAARAFGTLEFKGGLMNGSALSADDVRTIARLPGREVLHGQLVGTIAAPLSGLVRTLNALIAGLAIQLGQMAEQGLVTGSDPATPSAEPSAEAEAEAEGEAAAAEAEAAPEREASAAEAEDAPAPEPEAEDAPAPEPEAEDAPAPEPEAEAAPAEAPEAEDAPAPEPEAEAAPAEAEAAPAEPDAEPSPEPEAAAEPEQTETDETASDPSEEPKEEA